MEDRFKDSVTDKTGEHPMQSDEYHRAIGVINDDFGTNAI